MKNELIEKILLPLLLIVGIFVFAALSETGAPETTGQGGLPPTQAVVVDVASPTPMPMPTETTEPTAVPTALVVPYTNVTRDVPRWGALLTLGGLFLFFIFIAMGAAQLKDEEDNMGEAGKVGKTFRGFLFLIWLGIGFLKFLATGILKLLKVVATVGIITVFVLGGFTFMPIGSLTGVVKMIWGKKDEE